jgi:hypothetical protein
MAKRRKPVRPYPRELEAARNKGVLDPPPEFCMDLGNVSHAESGLWRLCPEEQCGRIRRCHKNDAWHCSIDHYDFLLCLRYAAEAGCAGLSAVAAARAAVRRVLAGRNRKAAAGRGAGRTAVR